MANKTNQRLIIIASANKNGSIEVKTDFFPKMPTLKEWKENKSPRKELCAVINQFSLHCNELIKIMTTVNDKDEKLFVADFILKTMSKYGVDYDYLKKRGEENAG